MVAEKFNYYYSFKQFLFSEIKRKWCQDRPQDFIKCDAVGEEYENCNHAPYYWYMKVINGDLPSNVYNKLSDETLYRIGKEVIENRVKLYESMINSENIVMWCVENIRV